MQNISSSSAGHTRPDVTLSVTRGVVRLCMNMGFCPLLEFKLANGRRADVAALDRKGKLTIIEVKSCKEDFEVDHKWQDYLEYCDEFFFAVAEDFPMALLPEETGLIIADGFGGAVVRPAIADPLAAARRKAVTLRFARQSALRAINVGEPTDEDNAPNQKGHTALSAKDARAELIE